MELRVMTYNVQGHAVRKNGRHLDHVAAVILNYGADVVGLQEIHCHTARSRSIDQATALAEATGMNLYFGKSCSLFGGDYGNAVLTRGILESGRSTELPGKGEQRTLLNCVVRFDGKKIDVLVTHLTAWGRLKRKEREKQLCAIADSISESGSPFVLMGDFNTAPRSPEMSVLSEGGRVLLCGDRPMATHRLTRAHYDHIYAGGGGWRVKKAEVLREGPSDHWPVVAELALDA